MASRGRFLNNECSTTFGRETLRFRGGGPVWESVWDSRFNMRERFILRLADYRCLEEPLSDGTKWVR